MKYRYAFLPAFIFVCSGLGAEDLAERIQKSAIAMTEAYLREDSAALVQYTAEAVLRRTGGAAVTAARIQAEFESNRKENIRLVSYKFIKPDRIHFSHGQLFALIERKSVWQLPDQKMNLRYNVLAVSTDGGATWRFAEASSISEEIFRELFGFFDPQLFGEFYKYTSERCNCKS